MRVHQKRKECWLLALEPDEGVQTVVEAFARASFEMARPAGISAITSFDPSIHWQSVRAEALRGRRSPVDPSCLLAMDYVAGRRCKTAIRKGKKYLTIFPGDGREQEMETMYLLAMK
jgi:hypothetical protein